MAPARAVKASPTPIVTGRIRDQLELYRKIFANSTDGIAVIDTRGRYIEQNSAHSQITGFSDQDLAGQTPAIHLGEETFRKIAAILHQGSSFRGEVVSRSKAGLLRTMELAAFPVTNERGEPLCFVGMKRDITERRRAEQERSARVRELENVYALTQALNRALGLEEVYSAALDSLAHATGSHRASILLYDENKIMRFTAWRDLSEEYRRAVDGHSPWSPDAVDPDPIAVADVETESSMAVYRNVFRQEGVRALAFIPICHEGILLGKFMVYFDEPHEFSDAELRLAEVIAAHIGFAINRHRTEQALQRSEKLAAAGRLAATVAHEINNPLEAVTNLLFLAKGESAPDKIHSYIADAERELARVSEIARQTLAFYRDNGAQKLVNVAELLDSAVAVYHTRISEGHIQIQKRYSSDDLRICGSPGELRQLFSNLIVNAIDATSPGGSVNITASAADGVLQVEIADTGTGISAQHLAHIFEPFFTTKLHVGTGLGLWVAREVAKKHHGTVELTSSTDPSSHGTRAVVRLAAEPGGDATTS